ncbi:hypothetical protein [Paraburkholderia kururiensis]|uniref:Uncharacterized protein n=1 Tax=Paraburkholderia kururiensis TaxID=984307 RepID=A0ABZ0WRZ9_9BURK|nr:hypothetical protein [Paraburkholderia kururiensis]WQD80174.1 hypothetical protein U0042_11085 [Paraburkholderia kururiensis]
MSIDTRRVTQGSEAGEAFELVEAEDAEGGTAEDAEDGPGDVAGYADAATWDMAELHWFIVG